ncbi:hypothetical protein EJ07DRAFT_152289 [Lizonia empirigonia]|nr:hypothetical protein EJ07DRAFT_152289 [Lizonia empirigonia]
MANRNLFAPRPPGSMLTEVPYETAQAPRKPEEDVRVISTMVLSAAQEYELRRQSCGKAYQKDRQEYLEGRGRAVRETAPNNPSIFREPSRYLKALLKFEPHRKNAIDLMFQEDKLTVRLDLTEILEPLVGMATTQRQRCMYKTAEPTEQDCCQDCGKDVTTYASPINLPHFLLTPYRLRIDRAYSHLLQCARRRRIKRGQEQMSEYFEYLRICLWNDCRYRFNGKSCGAYSFHVSQHLQHSMAHQCLWDSCLRVFSSHEDLAVHIWEAHDVPSEWTTYTKMHYCYEYDVWCCSDRTWNTHLQKKHLEVLNDYCGLIKEGGAVVVAAHCLFCIGADAPLALRFAQFSDVFVLHKHMKEHLTTGCTLKVCPHPLCEEHLTSEGEFWDHATTVHGIPPFGPRRVTGKRKAAEDNAVDGMV